MPALHFITAIPASQSGLYSGRFIDLWSEQDRQPQHRRRLYAGNAGLSLPAIDRRPSDKRTRLLEPTETAEEHFFNGSPPILPFSTSRRRARRRQIDGRPLALARSSR
jgi:hypothetical protein